GRPAAAAAAFDTTLKLYRDASRPYLEARAAERLGICQLTGPGDSNAEILMGALEQFESLGAVGDSARVRKELRRFGVIAPRPSQRRGRRSYGTELSPREREVARLAAKGLSDEEIAAQLYLSRRTVNHHVSSVLAKLGLRSRRQLSAKHHGASLLGN
ncbi:MAG: helix-turn-helix transcriptional regulator, partial [Candidatus Dormibacteria bacterium]